MAWSSKRKPDLVDDLDIFIGDLCTKWGFCNDLVAKELVVPRQALSALQFAEAVLRAEGMTPEIEVEWKRKIRQAFRKRYGEEVSPEAHANQFSQ